MDYLKVFEEELKEQGLIYKNFGYDNADFKSPNVHFIIMKRTFLGCSLGERIIGELISIPPLDKDYHTSCPLRIQTIDEKQEGRLERFAKSYQSRLNTRVELLKKNPIDYYWDDFED